MKKFIVTFLLLITGVSMYQIHAADVKGLLIGDRSVEMSIYDFVSKIKPTGLSSGTITYDNSTQSLTLDNITFNTKTTAINNIHMSGLKIYVKGTCNIYCSDPVAAMYFSSNTTITGLDYSAKLNVVSTAGKGLNLSYGLHDNVTLKTYWLDLSVWAPQYPIYASGCHLQFNYSKVDAIVTGTASDSQAIMARSLVLVDEVCTNGQFLENNSIYDSNHVAPKEVHILPKLAIGGFIVPLSRTDMSSLPEDARAAAGITSGTVEWDNSTKELKFTNVKQNVTSTWCGITNMGVDDLKVTFSGTNNLTTPSNHVIYSEKDITLQGNSTNTYAYLTSKSNDFSAIKSLNNLKVADMYLQTTAYEKSIEGVETNSALTIDNASVSASANVWYGKAISGFASYTKNISEVDSPYGCDWRESLHGFGTGNTLAQFVGIMRPTETYPVSIFGHVVNDANRANMIIFDGVTSGDISYDVASNKLILKGVTLDSPTGNTEAAISVNGVDIELTGTNKINSTGSCFNIRDTLSITGSGNMTAKSSAQHGITVTNRNTKLTLATTNDFLVYAKRYGYYGCYSDELALTKAETDNYGYRFQGDNGAIRSLGKLTLKNMDYAVGTSSDRSDYYFNGSNVVQNGGSIVKSSLGVSFGSIKERLGIYVAGKELCRVQDESYNIYVGSPSITTTGSSPAVTYSPSTKTLTLNNATIKYDGDDIQFKTLMNYGKIGDLNINVVGDNIIDNINYCAIGISDISYTAIPTSPTTTIKGSGTLKAKAKNIAGYICSKAKLVIDGVQASFEGGDYGIGDNNNMNNQKILTIQNNAAVKATGGKGAITKLSSIKLYDGISVSKPANGVIKQVGSNGYGIYEGSTLATTAILSNGNSMFDIKMGDANGDGFITMADANLVVNYFLATDKSTININLEAANVNGDTDSEGKPSITMADANQIVNMYLTGESQ